MKTNPYVKESLTAQDHIPDATKMVKRPQNCGTGFCSCIECVVKPGHIAPVRKMVPDHFADAGNKVSDHIAASGKVILIEEQAQQIEEALDELRYANNTDIAKTKYYKALSTIRTARAQADHIAGSDKMVREPVAWGLTDETGEVLDCISNHYKTTQPCTVDYDLPLYAVPVQRQWVDLTDDEIYPMYNEPTCDKDMVEFARAVIAAFKEKNK